MQIQGGPKVVTPTFGLNITEPCFMFRTSYLAVELLFPFIQCSRFQSSNIEFVVIFDRSLLIFKRIYLQFKRCQKLLSLFIRKPYICGSSSENLNPNGPSEPKLLSNLCTSLAQLIGLSCDTAVGQSIQALNEVPMGWSACQVIRSHCLMRSSDHLIPRNERTLNA